jgi:branched-subunit amino acid transport protein
VGTLNRNIITAADIDRLLAAKHRSEVPKTLDISPPAGAAPSLMPSARLGGGQSAEPEPTAAVVVPRPGVKEPTEDDYLTKLLKYVPPEIIGAYVFLTGIINSNVTDKTALRWWLAALLVAMLALTAVYDRRVLNIIRGGQILMSVIALAAYAFAGGGWFATTSWYHPWYGTIALVVFGLLVALVRMKPLPTPAEDAGGGRQIA